METKLILPETIGSEITIREGQALELKEPVQNIIEGDINSVATFLSIRQPQDLINANKAVVIADKDNLKISLLLDPENPYGAEVHATLEISSELKEFHINQSYTYSREQFVKLIRFNKIWFDSADVHEKLLTQVMAFTANTNVDVKAASDNRSNKSFGLNKATTSDLLPDFILNIPIFKGENNSRFRVEIAYDVTEGSVKFWLESVELHEATTKKTDEIFSTQLKAANGLVIINK